MQPSYAEFCRGCTDADGAIIYLGLTLLADSLRTNFSDVATLRSDKRCSCTRKGLPRCDPKDTASRVAAEIWISGTSEPHDTFHLSRTRTCASIVSVALSRATHRCAADGCYPLPRHGPKAKGVRTFLYAREVHSDRRWRTKSTIWRHKCQWLGSFARREIRGLFCGWPTHRNDVVFCGVN